MVPKSDIIDDDRYEFKGVKIAHELMVDILGALIPGALFLFCIIVCIVFPLICFASPNNNFGFLMKDGDWFWIVAFLSFLILSYVIGLIFYRADIKVPDRRDIRREQKKKLDDLLKNMPVKTIDVAQDYVAELLIQEIRPLEQCLSSYRADCDEPLNSVYNDDFIKSCNECLEALSNENKNSFARNNAEYSYSSFSLQRNLLKVLFPEWDFNNTKDYCSTDTSDKKNKLFPDVKHIPNAVKNVIRQASTILPKVERYIKKHIKPQTTVKDKYDNNDKEVISLCRLIVSYMILHLQNESGCATEDRCDFPYMSYYKYLLKRELKDLLKYVKWYTPASRTKNQLNLYKIDLQLHVPNAFSIITKNESHIRMASSSWHVAKIVKVMSIITGLIMLSFVVLSIVYHSKNDDSFNRIPQDNTAKVVVVHKENANHTVKDVPVKTSLSKHDFSETEDIAEPQSQSGFTKIVDSYLYFISRTNIANEYLAFLFPLLVFLLSLYILKSVPKFIHYQRLREIYYTLSIYKLWEDAKCESEKKYNQNLAIRKAQANIAPESSDTETAGNRFS